MFFAGDAELAAGEGLRNVGCGLGKHAGLNA